MSPATLPDFDLTPPTEAQFQMLTADLSKEERLLLLEHGEEAPFCGVFLTEMRNGIYACRLCGLPLFKGGAKFESGTGWPSFTAPFAEGYLRKVRDTSFGMTRTEIVCARCGAHMGHVFPDGPPPTGQRYCINSGSLEFAPQGTPLPDKLGRGAPEGEPAQSVLGLDLVLDHLRRLVGATDLPINADFENGFADDPADVAANIGKAVATGVAGISLEDWSGSRLYDAGLATERVAAARAAIDAIDPQVMLIGRSEHFRVPGTSVSASINRAAAYATAGVDCLFVPMIADPGSLKELVAAVAPKPVSVLLPSLDADLELFVSLGVRRCSTGTLLASAAWDAFERAARMLNAADGR